MDELVRRLLDLEDAVRTLQRRESPLYAKGTWTPVYAGATTAGTTTYTAQYGVYTQIGRLVVFSGIVGWSAATGTGQALIRGLPVVAANVANNFSAVTIRPSAVTFTGSAIDGLIRPNTTQIELESPVSNAASATVAVEAAGSLVFSGMYVV